MRARAVTLALLCVLAGCSSLPGADGPDHDTTSVTPADVPREMHGGTVAPGLTRERVVDATALLDAHLAALRNRSLTVRSNRTRVSVSPDNGVTTGRERRVVRADSTRQRIHIVTRYEQPTVNVSRQEVWLGPERPVALLVAQGSRQYVPVQSDAAESIRQSPAPRFYERAVPVLDEVTVARSGTTNDGYPRYRVRAVEPVLPAVGQTTRDRFETRNVSVDMTVDARGVIHRYRLRYEFRDRDGEEWHPARIEYAVTAVDETTVERPDWYGDAVAATENRTTAR